MSNIEKIKTEFLEPLKPKMLAMGLTMEKFNKEAGFVCQIWNDPKNGYLRKSSKESLFSAVISIAQTGLTLNPVAKQAYLIPRAGQAHLEPSYIGLMKLLTDAGQVKNIQTNLVYEGDAFDVNLGLETTITHKPHYVNGQVKGKLIGVYSVANLSDGNKQYEHMTRQEIEDIRATSESYKAYERDKSKSCIWISFEGEMFRKTCIKRIAKHLPRSEQYNQADSLSNKDFEMTYDQLAMLENLIHNSSLLEHELEQIERELPTMNFQGASKAIGYLKQNQKTTLDQQLDSKLEIEK